MPFIAFMGQTYDDSFVYYTFEFRLPPTFCHVNLWDKESY